MGKGYTPGHGLYATAMAILNNPRLEILAQGIALGKNMYDAAKDAGYNPGASSFRPNTRRRVGRPDVKARVKELQERSAAAATAATTVTLAWVMEKLTAIAGAAFDPNDIKPADALKAADMIVKIQGFYAPEKREIIARLSELSMEELARLDAALSAGAEEPTREELH